MDQSKIDKMFDKARAKLQSEYDKKIREVEDARDAAHRAFGVEPKSLVIPAPRKDRRVGPAKPAAAKPAEPAEPAKNGTKRPGVKAAIWPFITTGYFTVDALAEKTGFNKMQIRSALNAKSLKKGLDGQRNAAGAMEYKYAL